VSKTALWLNVVSLKSVSCAKAPSVRYTDAISHSIITKLFIIIIIIIISSPKCKSVFTRGSGTTIRQKTQSYTYHTKHQTKLKQNTAHKANDTHISQNSTQSYDTHITQNIKLSSNKTQLTKLMIHTSHKTAHKAMIHISHKTQHTTLHKH
jgi:hypothetical protein